MAVYSFPDSKAIMKASVDAGGWGLASGMHRCKPKTIMEQNTHLQLPAAISTDTYFKVHHWSSLKITDGYMGVPYSILSPFVYIWNFP